MGRAEELFKRIVDGGAAEVHNMITAPIVEELFLDYKRSTTGLPARRLSDEDRRNLAKAIGGFANSEGGVVVWGVDCRSTPAGDIPTGPVLISDPMAPKTLFDAAVTGLTLPAHAGVENVPLGDTSTGGFVVTHVPAGLHVPYQTLVPKTEYHMRAGSSFSSIPHGVLAGMFGRVPQPNVTPVVRLRNMQNVGGGQVVRVDLQISVRNNGRGLADDVFCIVELSLPRGVSAQYERQDHPGWRSDGEGRDAFTLLLNEFRLPPGTARDAFGLGLELSQRPASDCFISVSCGASGGPGGACDIVLKSHTLTETYAQLTFGGLTAIDRREAEERIASLLKRDLSPR
jgi:hypothetical protein